MLFILSWLYDFVFLLVAGPVQLSYSSAGVHPKQRPSQSSLSLPGEVEALFVCFGFSSMTLVY